MYLLTLNIDFYGLSAKMDFSLVDSRHMHTMYIVQQKTYTSQLQIAMLTQRVSYNTMHVYLVGKYVYTVEPVDVDT